MDIQIAATSAKSGGLLGRARGRGEPTVSNPAAATYAELFREHFRGMVALATLLNAEDPENVAQEAFVRLHAKQKLLRDPFAARAYLRTTVVNLTRSGHRHLRVVRQYREPPAVLPRGVEDTVMSSYGNAHVLTALTLISARHREALVLRYWAELSEKEMAEAMKVSTGTVKAHVSRGLVALEAALAAQEGSS